MSVTAPLRADAVRAAVAAVDDPEYPGLSIADLGIVETVSVGAGGTVAVDLVPTFTGCPALDLIRADVERAVGTVEGVAAVTVRFVTDPVWSPERITAAGRARLREEFHVAVPLGDVARCPRCGSTALVESSPFGPSPCRSIWRCDACVEPVEVVRR